MKTYALAAFALSVILSQVACSNDQAAQYAAANACTIGGLNATTVTGGVTSSGSQAAAAQVPCSFQNAAKAVIDTSSVAASQVNTGTATTSVASEAALQKAVAEKSVSVKQELANLGVDTTPVKSESLDLSAGRSPSSVAMPSAGESAGFGEASR